MDSDGDKILSQRTDFFVGRVCQLRVQMIGDRCLLLKIDRF